MATDVAEGAACMPNLSAGARRLRTHIARGALVFAFVALVVATDLETTLWVRALVFFVPAFVACAAYLEAKSSVCVLRAAQGTYEDDGLRKTRMEASYLPAIRRVATSIWLKSVFAALGATVLVVLVSRAF